MCKKIQDEKLSEMAPAVFSSVSQDVQPGSNTVILTSGPWPRRWAAGGRWPGLPPSHRGLPWLLGFHTFPQAQSLVHLCCPRLYWNQGAAVHRLASLASPPSTPPLAVRTPHSLRLERRFMDASNKAYSETTNREVWTYFKSPSGPSIA